jgi:hypothetical protein
MIACGDDNPGGDDFFSWLFEPEELDAAVDVDALDDVISLDGTESEFELVLGEDPTEREYLENERLRCEWLGLPLEEEIVCDDADLYTIQLDDEDEGFDFVLEDPDG